MKRVRFTYYPSHEEIFSFHAVCTHYALSEESKQCAWTSALVTGRSAFRIYQNLERSLHG